MNILAADALDTGIHSTLQWRHNGRDSLSNHQPHECFSNRSFRCRSKKPSKLRVTGLCAGNSPGTGEFPAQMASNVENVAIWWRFHDDTHCRWISTGCGMVYWQLNSLRLSDEYMHHQPKTSLVHIMSCGLFGAKPSYEPTLYYLLSTGPLGTNFSQIVFGIWTFLFNKMCLKMSRKC